MRAHRMKYLYSLLIVTLIFISGCSSDQKKQRTEVKAQTKLAKLESPLNNTVVKKGDPIKLELTLKEKASEKIDSIGAYINDRFVQKLEIKTSNVQLNSENIPLGRNKLLVKIFKKDGLQENKFAQLKVIGNKVPKQYGFEVINEFPHNKESYTQGLLFHNGKLYESTGQRGQSKLLEIDLTTGEAIKEHKLPKNYFGEGLALINNRLFQLTWTSGQGFIYDLNTFKPIGNFGFTGEGWGLCTNGKHLILSNGTNELSFLNPDNFKVVKKLQVMDNMGQISKLNELEYINGEIWANYYQYNKFLIYRIDAKTGEINGVIDLSGILKKADNHPTIDVLNGIAYDAENDRIFVTGKNYPKIYEIKPINKGE
ncbi:MAG: glutaminyl-peptide cyclotransferase [Bacteroidia bacterium]